MASGDARRRPPIAAHERQRPHAAIVLLHVVAPERHRRKKPCYRREQIADLSLVGAGLRRITGIGNVGGAHEHEFRAEGKHEDGPAVCRLGIDTIVGERGPQRSATHHEVAPLRAADQPTAVAAFTIGKHRCQRAVRPGSCRVHD